MYPDILGYTLPQAVEVLNSKGYKYQIVSYSSPKRINGNDEHKVRVVRIRELPEAVLELVVC